MSEEKTAGIYSLTEPVVMSHPALFEARGFGKKGKETGELKFSANFVFNKDSKDLAAMKALAVKVARAKWPNVDLKKLKFPFADGTVLADRRKAKANKDDGAFQRDKIVVAARSKYEPKLAGFENGVLTDYEDAAMRAKAKSKFFFGAEVLAQFNFVAYDGVGANPDGVTAYLNMVLATGKGERLSQGQSAAQAFGGYVGKASTEDPTGASVSADDEIPF